MARLADGAASTEVLLGFDAPEGEAKWALHISPQRSRRFESNLAGASRQGLFAYGPE